MHHGSHVVSQIISQDWKGKNTKLEGSDNEQCEYIQC